jgi:sphingolipid 4-desaturase/C4-monooxygenase
MRTFEADELSADCITTKILATADEKTDVEVTKRLNKRASAMKEADPSVACDRRFPLYLSDWLRSIPYRDEYFAKDDLDEPHAKRKHTILKFHPEIAKLQGYDTSTKWITLGCVLLQLTLAYLFSNYWQDQRLAFYLCAYIIGGTATQIIGVILHEITHNLTAESSFANRMVGLLGNVIIPFPIAMSFRRYHLDHHAYQGVPGYDPDLPVDVEIPLIRGNRLLKFVWLFCYPLLYVGRGAVFFKNPQFWEYVNWAFTITTDTLIWSVAGWDGLWYLFVSLWFGYGIHPAAGHFISEHYTIADRQETFSTYSKRNWLFMNIGYHNEHHDFPRVPWTKLPEIKSLAPEFYNTLKHHTSFTKVLWNFVMDKTLGPQSRVHRSYEDHKTGRRMLSRAIQ